MPDDRVIISDFFRKIAEDPKLAEEYKANPKKLLEKQGISKEAIKLIETGDIAKLCKLFASSTDHIYPFLVFIFFAPELKKKQ
jgi:hypothetical protein